MLSQKLHSDRTIIFLEQPTHKKGTHSPAKLMRLQIKSKRGSNAAATMCSNLMIPKSHTASTHLVSVAEAAAALLLAASACWLWEVEEDALLHLEGIMAVLAGRGASLEVVQGQHVVEICLVWSSKTIALPL